MGEGTPFKNFKGEGVVFKPPVLMFAFKPLKWAIGFGNFKHFFVGQSFLMCKGRAFFLRFMLRRHIEVVFGTKSLTQVSHKCHTSFTQVSHKCD